MQSSTWKTKDGLVMHAQSWLVKSPKAKLCLVHGMGEHIGRYDHLASYYNSKGISVYGYDHRGHGKSEGQRGHSPSFNHLINDLKIFITQVSKQEKHLPILLYGHSMGGNVVLNFTFLNPHYQIATVATGPWIELAFKPNAMLIFFAKLIRNLYPEFSQSTKLDVKALSHDESVVSKYTTDPLVHSTISAAMAMDLMKAGKNLLAIKQAFKIPVLLMHGSKDQLTSFDASVNFADLHPELIFKSWPGMFHEIHNEPDKKEVFDLTFDWLKNIMDQL